MGWVVIFGEALLHYGSKPKRENIPLQVVIDDGDKRPKGRELDM